MLRPDTAKVSGTVSVQVKRWGAGGPNVETLTVPVPEGSFSLKSKIVFDVLDFTSSLAGVPANEELDLDAFPIAIVRLPAQHRVDE